MENTFEHEDGFLQKRSVRIGENRSQGEIEMTEVSLAFLQKRERQIESHARGDFGRKE